MKSTWILSVVVAVLLGALVGVWFIPSPTKLGSVDRSGEYHSTRMAVGMAATTSPVGAGVRTLGSVVITSSTPTFTLLDWDGTTSTVSTTLSVFKAGIAEGTYTYDVSMLNGGLYISLPATNTGSFTITWR